MTTAAAAAAAAAAQRCNRDQVYCGRRVKNEQNQLRMFEARVSSDH